ncbi:hypothetical protein MKX01_004921 [Papaver californicum]|nr:hypothetical protein MKX01_004921 [Papaver californicum]
MDQDYVGVKPEEEQPSDRLFEPSKDSSVPSTDIGLENVTAKKKKRRDHGDDGYARTENMVQDHVEVQPEDVQPTDKLESVFTPKKKHRRNRGEDGDAKTKSMDQDLAGVKPEKEQLTDKLSEPSKDSSIPSNNIGLQSDVKPKKKIRRNHGEDVDAKNKDMDQDLVEIKTRKKQPNDKIINSVGHVTNQR